MFKRSCVHRKSKYNLNKLRKVINHIIHMQSVSGFLYSEDLLITLFFLLISILAKPNEIWNMNEEFADSHQLQILMIWWNVKIWIATTLQMSISGKREMHNCFLGTQKSIVSNYLTLTSCISCVALLIMKLYMKQV